jgi:hypothetical protein
MPSRTCPDYAIDFSTISKSITDVFANLRYLSSVLESKDSFSIAQIDSMWYSDKVYLLQRSLVYLSLDPEQAVVNAACCIAASMYVDSYFRDLGFYSNVIALMVTKLKMFLDQRLQNVITSPAEYNEDELSMVLWTLIIGGILAMKKPERSWFLERLRSFREALRLETRAIQKR